MPSYKAIIAYDGTDFHGWQLQQESHTVCAALQESFHKAFNHTVSVVGASRTDAGVHALGQVARCTTTVDLDSEQLKTIWNFRLPRSIVIKELTRIENHFHPCAHVKQKTYYYQIFWQIPHPFVGRYGWLCPFGRFVDQAKFERILSLYRGEHDFRSFCKLAYEQSTVRTIDDIYLEHFPRFGMSRVVIKGKSFLHFQIRRMIGYALDVARQPDTPEDHIKQLLENPSPLQTLAKAEPAGLCLKRIIYE